MSSEKTNGIVANFKYLDEFCEVLEALRKRDDFSGYEAYSPTSYHEIEHAAGFKASPVRFCTLIGALTGMISGFALCVAMDLAWPLVVGGKPPGFGSLPAFVVIGFEMTILFGAFGTIFGMLFFGRLANPKAKIYALRATDDRFSIFVPNIGTNSSQAQVLKDMGADEVISV